MGESFRVETRTTYQEIRFFATLIFSAGRFPYMVVQTQ